MRGLRRWAGYAALNRPLTILGVERRGFLLVATFAASAAVPQFASTSAECGLARRPTPMGVTWRSVRLGRCNRSVVPWY